MMSALERLAMYEIRRIGDEATEQGYVTDEDADHSERCWDALSHLAYLRDREDPPPALAAALARIPLSEVA